MPDAALATLRRSSEMRLITAAPGGLAAEAGQSPSDRRHVENAYVRMWARWQRGEAPISFTVEPEQDAAARDDVC